MARDLSPWLVHVAFNAAWDPGLKAEAGRGRPVAMEPVFALCQRFRVPVVLAVGSGTGWISEPLAIEAGRLQITGGGTRCMGAIPAGGTLASLPDEIALGLEGTGLVGIAATPIELVVALVGLDAEASVHTLRYETVAPDLPVRGAGWGSTPVDETKRVWLAGGDQAAAALEDLSWLALTHFEKLHLGNDEFTRLVTAASTDATALRLMRRLLSVEGERDRHIVPALARLPPVIRRDLALRQFASKRRLVEVETWSITVTEGSDVPLLCALLRSCEKDRNVTHLKLLMMRLRNQADGRIPLEEDPVLQHRIMCAVFDSELLSPTPLREIALALRPKVDALGKGPIERFLKRVGDKRPPGQ
jgi:hypothetical protein